MPFNTLLLTSLVHKTSFSESGSGLRVCPRAGEKALFFVIDDHPDCAFRKDFGITEPICDLVVFYIREDQGKYDKVLCLVESKGCDIGHALKQIESTRRHLEKELKSRPCKSHLGEVDWMAYVFVHGSAPKNIKHLERTSEWKNLVRVFGKGKFAVSSNPDLSEFLRR